VFHVRDSTLTTANGSQLEPRAFRNRFSLGSGKGNCIHTSNFSYLSQKRNNPEEAKLALV
jgi:hypothetical protein